MATKFYQVGGCVRDAIMGVRSKDIDFSVESDSFESMREAIISRCGGNPDCIKVEKPEYATIRAVDPKLGGVDFVLCRKDGYYSDGRRPDSVERGTLLDDLSRRDFTCNAIAMDDEGNFIDPFNGVEDINKKILRCVGSTDRLKEDALRMIRAIRFCITKGLQKHFELDMFLLKKENAKLVANISKERIREELNKCFAFDTLLTLDALQRYSAIRDEIFQDREITLDSTLKKR